MAEKMYSFTHAISETKLLALISQHADEVRIDIMEAPQKKGQRRLQNGTPSPLMIEGPKRQATQPSHQEPAAPGPAPFPMRKGAGGKKSTPHLTLEYLALHRNRIVPMAELETNAVKHHKPKHAVSVAISGFLKKGLVERVGKAQYKILQEGIAKIGAVDASPTTKHAPRQKQKGVGRGNYTRVQGMGPSLIWAALVEGEPVALQPLRQTFRDNNLTPASVSARMHKFVQRGLASRTGSGLYQITKQGMELYAKQRATASQLT